jgi:hypothetical protein
MQETAVSELTASARVERALLEQDRAGPSIDHAGF